MLFYYVQIKERHDSGVIMGEKVSIETKGGGGCSEALSRDFRGQSALRKLFSPKRHLDWFIIDLNAAKIITVLDYN